MKLNDLKKANTVDDLEALGIGRLVVDIGPRGGGLGFYGSDVAATFGVSEGDLPNKYGAGCNYLGGGVRGSIFPSGYNKAITGRTAKLLDALAAACIRAYENIENDNGLNDAEDADGETNWDAAATAASRKAGIESAY